MEAAKLTPEIVGRVRMKVNACLGLLVGGSGHFAAYTMRPITFRISRLELLPDGNTRYWFSAQASIQTEFEDDDGGDEPETISGEIVLTPTFEVALDAEGRVLLSPWRTSYRPGSLPERLSGPPEIPPRIS